MGRHPWQHHSMISAKTVATNATVPCHAPGQPTAEGAIRERPRNLAVRELTMWDLIYTVLAAAMDSCALAAELLQKTRGYCCNMSICNFCLVYGVEGNLGLPNTLLPVTISYPLMLPRASQILTYQVAADQGRPAAAGMTLGNMPYLQGISAKLAKNDRHYNYDCPSATTASLQSLRCMSQRWGEHEGRVGLGMSCAANASSVKESEARQPE